MGRFSLLTPEAKRHMLQEAETGAVPSKRARTNGGAKTSGRLIQYIANEVCRLALSVNPIATPSNSGGLSLMPMSLARSM
jgi:hypothetical protein